MSKSALVYDQNEESWGYRHTGNLATSSEHTLTVAQLNERFKQEYKQAHLSYICLPCAVDELFYESGLVIAEETRSHFLQLLSEERKENLNSLRTYSLTGDMESLLHTYRSKATDDAMKKLTVTPVKAMEAGTGEHGLPHLRHLPGFGCSQNSLGVSPARQAAAFANRLANGTEDSLTVTTSQREVNGNYYFLFDLFVDNRLTARHYLSCETGRPNYHDGLRQLIEADYKSMDAQSFGQVLVISTARPAQGHALLLRGELRQLGLDIQVMHLGFPNSADKLHSSQMSCNYYPLYWGDVETHRWERMTSRQTFSKTDDDKCSRREQEQEKGDAEGAPAFIRKGQQLLAFEAFEGGSVSHQSICFGWLGSLPISTLETIANKNSEDAYVRHARNLYRAHTDGTFRRIVDSAIYKLADAVDDMTLSIRRASVADKHSLLTFDEAQDLFFGVNLTSLLPPASAWNSTAAVAYEELFDLIQSTTEECRKQLTRELGSSTASKRAMGAIARGLTKRRSINKQFSPHLQTVDPALAAVNAEALVTLQEQQKIKKRFSSELSAELSFDVPDAVNLPGDDY